MIVRMLAVGIGFFIFATDLPGRHLTAGAESPQQLMSRTRAYLGGDGQLASVRAMEFVEPGRTTRVLFPDRYQFILSRSGRDEVTTITFDGHALWRRPEPIAEQGSPAEVETRGRRYVAEQALMYLLRIQQPFRSVRVADAVSCASTGDVCLEVSGTRDAPVFMSFDRTTAVPVAMVRPLGESGSAGRGVVRLQDYRPVDGVMVPHRTVASMVDVPGVPDREIGPTVYSAIKMNPDTTRWDFRK
jgi:hypothetical protein